MMIVCFLVVVIFILFLFEEMEYLTGEIEKLKIERMQLEFHVERTGSERIIDVCNHSYLSLMMMLVLAMHCIFCTVGNWHSASYNILTI